MSGYYDGMTRTEQLDSWFARLTAWMRESCGPATAPPGAPQFVWDMLRAEAKRLDGFEAATRAAMNDPAIVAQRVAADEAYARATMGLAGQPPIEPLHAPYHSAATQAAVALLKGAVKSLCDEVNRTAELRKQCGDIESSSNERTMADGANYIVRALELLGVKP